MSSVLLSWPAIKTYRDSVGPGVGRPSRPGSCASCDGTRIWFDGWRVVFAVVLVDGSLHRFDDGLPLQRVECSSCERSWTIRPSFLYPHRSFEPDVNEAAALFYLADPAATYASAGARFDCSPRSVWRWIGWLADLIVPAVLMAMAARHGAVGAIGIVPRDVPHADRKARSTRRRQRLLLALQVIAALSVLSRAQRVPPTDPSPLRVFLGGRFLAFRQIAYVARSGLSPPLPDLVTGSSG